jgi:integral membrane protein (TIGR01906 family)
VLAAVTAAAIAFTTPAILVVNGLRLAATDRAVTFEYGRDGFPEDRYGLTRAERTALGLIGLDAIRPGSEGVVLLRRATLPDGSAAFNEREIAHMDDVRRVFGRALRAQLLVLGAVVVLAIVLWRSALRWVVPAGLLGGALATLAVALLAIPVILLGFDGFFTRFHGVFFEGDSWRFPAGDTLIRIYPDRLWEDVSQLVAGLTLLQAALLAPASWLWLRRARRHEVRA